MVVKNITEKKTTRNALDESFDVTYRLHMANRECVRCSGRGKGDWAEANGICYGCKGTGRVEATSRAARFEVSAALEVLEDTYRDARRGVRASDAYVAHALGRIEGHPRHARAVEAFRSLGYAV